MKSIWNYIGKGFSLLFTAARMRWLPQIRETICLLFLVIAAIPLYLAKQSDPGFFYGFLHDILFPREERNDL